MRECNLTVKQSKRSSKQSIWKQRIRYGLLGVAAFIGQGVFMAGGSSVLAAPAQSINIDAYQFAPLPAVLEKESGTLILSDSPEYVDQNGVVAGGTVNGTGRVYFYHVNDMDTPHRVGIVVENTGKKDVDVIVHRQIATEPSTEYFAVGRWLSKSDLTHPYVEADRWQTAAQHNQSLATAGFKPADSTTAAATGSNMPTYVPITSSAAQDGTNQSAANTAVTGPVAATVANTVAPQHLSDGLTSSEVTVTKDTGVTPPTAGASGRQFIKVNLAKPMTQEERDQAARDAAKRAKEQAKEAAKQAKLEEERLKNLKPTVLEKIHLIPGGRADLYKKLDEVVVNQDQLFSGLVDFTSTGAVSVKVMMTPADVSPIVASIYSNTLPMDSVMLRGTYTGAKRQLVVPVAYNSSVGAAAVEVANDREDPFVVGHDELTHDMKVTDKGNYGVSYDITIPTQGREPFALYFNPMGGAYAGSVEVEHNGKSQIFDVPDWSLPHMGDGTVYDTQYLATYNPGKPLVIHMMPAGASNLPVRFLLIPVSLVPNV